MKVLMQTRADYDLIRGGDTTQLEKTRHYLQALGVEVDVSLDHRVNLAGYDLVHIFNLQTVNESYAYARNAMRQKVPFVLSTIYWDFNEFNRVGRPAFQRWLYRILGDNRIETFKDFYRQRRTIAGLAYDTTPPKLPNQRRRWLIENAEVILPNSDSEGDVVCKVLQANPKKVTVVCNAVEVPENHVADFPQVPPSVLSVARIDARKNTLALVKPMRRIRGVPLYLVGPSTSMHRRYLKEVLRQMTSDMVYLGPKDSSELPYFYRQAKVHALPSWLETPGLSSLEAAIYGCSIVASTRGSTRDYFGQEAFYCEPDSIDSIERAIRTALESDPSIALKNRITTEFTWQKAAEQTFTAYETALRFQGVMA